MSREETQFLIGAAIPSANSDGQGITILAVGNSDEWTKLGHKLPSDDSIHFASIEQIDMDFLKQYEPSVVVSPALALGFDCIDLALALHKAKYKGQYRAVSRDLPNPKMVEAEISHLCPGLDFTILSM
ncbi:MAG: hypothetical protein GKR98_04960 [Boseongicola sp.]|nr:MAG: hypothetical protein GKR98_04960 [Boseongicola sp.]